MCFGGGGVSQPQIIYQGPSEQDIASNRAALDQYRTQASAQQEAFSRQLQQQIDAANKESESIKAQYGTELSRIQQQQQDRIASSQKDAAAAVSGAQGKAAADVAAAGAAGAAQQMGAYAVTATQSAPVDGAQTTAATAKKEKPKGSLKISTAALPSAAGTGLNIGV
jgi:hypothetical protein